MDSDKIRIGLQIRRFLVISIRVFYRSVCNHPFLVGIVCFLIFLYRAFPFLFSLLVSASPVLVCTAVLLGTLLSFGEANIPEIEEEEEEDGEKETKVALEVSQLKAGILEDATVVVNRGNSHSSLRFRGKRRDAVEKTIEEESLVENGSGKMGEDDGLDDYVPLIDESSREIHSRKQVINDKTREIDDLMSEKKREIHEENQGIKEMLSHAKTAKNQYGLVQNGDNENLEEEDNITTGGYFDFSQDPSWKRANTNDEEEEDEKASDSDSDGAESSSPDASMADIIPMLHELHPLLDEEAPERPLISYQGSYAGSERSHKSKGSSVELEEDMENEADEEYADDDNDNEEEEEEVLGGKEDESKSAIKWTEDDQKNLMDLGTSELERNQRLENLIARRRTRRNMRLMAEKNLIDLDGADLPVNVPPISTTRQNPFDLPYDPYDDVPGSAPSILLPRRNPFDIPYESNEEKPDLKRDSFQQEFSAFQHREPVFRRHESFSIGPSVPGGPKQERQDFRWKPYFVPERYATEGTSYHAFQRQLSEASDSKVSSVLDTESVSSAVEEEDDRRANENVCQETERVSSVEHASILIERGSQSSEDIDIVGVEPVEKRDICQDEVEITLGEVESDHNIDSSLSASGGTTPVEQNTSEILLRMEPSEEEDSNRPSLSSLAAVDEKVSDLNTGSATLEPRISEIEESYISTQTSLDSEFQFVIGKVDGNACREPILGSQNDHFGEAVMSTQTLIGSGSKFTSAVDRVADDTQNKVPVLDSFGGHIHDSVTQHEGPILETESIPLGGSGISIQNSLKSDFCFPSGVVADNQPKEPVYDSSPPSVNEFLSFSSVSSSTLAEISEMGSPPTSAEFSGPEVLTESMKKDGSRESHEGSTQVHSLQKNESDSRHIMENDEEDTDDYNDNEEEEEEEEVQGGKEDESKSAIKWTEFDQKNLMDIGGEDILQLEQQSRSGAEIQVNGSPGGGEEFDFVAGSPRHVPSDDFNLSPHDEREMSVVTGKASDASSNELDQLDSSILEAKIIVGPHQNEIGELDSTSSSFQMAFENRTSPTAEEKHPPRSQEAEHVEECAAGREDILQLEQESRSDAGIQVNGSQGGGEELDFVAGSLKHVSSDDFNLSPHDERENSVVTGQVSGAFPDISSSETKHLEELPLRRDRTILSEPDPVHSSNSDVTTDANSHQELDVIVASSNYQHVHSDEKSLLELEKQLSWADKSIIEPPFNDHGELQEPSGALARIPEEVTNTCNISALNIHDHEDKLSRIITSLTSDSTSVPTESPEYKTPATGLYLKDNILDKFVYEDSDHVLEPSNSSAEAYGSPMGELYEDYIEIKEIDEGLLLELDAVGDFSVKEVVGESLHDEQMPGEKNSGGLDYDRLPNGSSLTEIKPEIPVLEARSVEDIDLAFEQHHERADVGEVILPNEIKDQFFEHEPSSPGQTSSELLVAEAKTLEDVHIAMNQVSRGNFDKPSRPSNSKDVVAEVKEAGSTEELPVLEVRTTEDIGLAFKQLQEGADFEDVIIASATEQPPVVNELKDPVQTSADLQVVETSSLEDIDIAMEQVTEGNTEEQSISSHLKDEAAKGDELGSTNEIPILEAKTVEDINLAFKQLEEGADVEEVILPSSVEQQLVVDESNHSGQPSSHLQVVEAKSLEDIQVAMKQVSGSNTENIPEAADPKDGSEKVDQVSASEDNTSRMLEVNEANFTKDMEAIKMGSTKESSSSNVESSVHETSSTDA